MSKIDAFEFDQRDRRAFKEFIREYDLDDSEDCGQVEPLPRDRRAAMHHQPYLQDVGGRR